MSKKVALIGDQEISTIGRFRLDYVGDKKRFTLTNLSSFVPYGKQAQDRVFFESPTGLVDHYMVNKPSISFKPDENEIDRRNVTVLIQHPQVRLAQMSTSDYQALVKKNLKMSNPKFVLTNIDKVEDDTFDRENELIIARATLRSQDDKISKNKLIWLCSKFGIPFRSDILDTTRYMQFLIRQLDSFLMKGNDNYNSKEAIKAFNESLKDIKKTEYIFYINEFQNIGIITDIGGIYKIGDKPIGAEYKAIMAYYDQNQALFDKHKMMVLDSLKGTIME